MRWIITFALILNPLSLAAGSLSENLASAQILLLGEVHDNPTHHRRQAEIVAQVHPKALVFEMLTQDQASRYVPGAAQAVQAQAFGWDESGWPDFALYHPIFAAAPTAQVFGAAVPRDRARAVMGQSPADVFGSDASVFGLDQPLSEDEKSAREAMQQTAHCDALPVEMLPMMVDIQRLRDAELARAAFEAWQKTGGPVVVITGNGHARGDWGIPVYLKHMQSDLRVVSLGQGEGGDAPSGAFDLTEITAPRPERPDPCAAFR